MYTCIQACISELFTALKEKCNLGRPDRQTQRDRQRQGDRQRQAGYTEAGLIYRGRGTERQTEAVRALGWA